MFCPKTYRDTIYRLFHYKEGKFEAETYKSTFEDPFVFCGGPLYEKTITVVSSTPIEKKQNPSLNLIQIIAQKKGYDIDLVHMLPEGIEHYLELGLPMDLLIGEGLFSLDPSFLNTLDSSSELLWIPFQLATGIREPIREPRYDLVLRPFNGLAWICFACFLLLCCISLAAVHTFYAKFMPNMNRAKDMTTKMDFLIVPFSAFAQRDPIRWFGKYAVGGHGMLAVWILGCLVVGKVHYGILRGFFQSGWYDVYETLQPLTIKDVVEQGYVIWISNYTASSV